MHMHQRKRNDVGLKYMRPERASLSSCGSSISPSPIFSRDGNPLKLFKVTTHEAVKCECVVLPDVMVFTEYSDLIHPTPTETYSEQPYQWYYLLAGVSTVAGGVGNILVILAVYKIRQLQNDTNYFLMSLAVADLLVCLVVMPLGAMQGFLGHWPLGLRWCNGYVTSDVLACSSSIMHMCGMSIGRYLGIKNPIRMRQSSKKTVAYKIALVWFVSILITSSITLLGISDPSNIMTGPINCVINNRAFWVMGSLIAFYIPMVIMMVTYGLTVRLLREKAEFAVAEGEEEQCRLRRIGGRYRRGEDSGQNQSAITSGKTTARSSSEHSLCSCTAGEREESESDGSMNAKRRTLKLTLNTTATPLNIRFLTGKPQRQGMSANVLASEQKATKVLGLVFISFVACWAPFFVLNLIFAFCTRCSIPPHVVDICLWAGYISSNINPIIYTVFNRTFREAFIRLLKLQCDQVPKRMMRQGATFRGGQRRAMPSLTSPQSPSSASTNIKTPQSNCPEIFTINIQQ